MSRRISILLVDDSPEDRAMVRRLLHGSRKQSYTVREAELGEDALALCGEERPDCVLLDFHLPDMDGVEFLTELERRFPGGAPTVMLTGQEDHAVAQKVLQTGAQDYLVKGSVTAPGLARATTNAIAKWAFQRQLAAQKAALEMRNQQLETYASVIAHDLRNPLHTIYMSSKFLLDLLPPDDREVERQHLGIINRAVERTERLVQDLLDVARMETSGLPLARQPTSAAVLVREAVELQQPSAASKRIRLRSEIADDLPRLILDAHQVLRVFQNLLENAVKFTPEGGSITVRADAADGGVRFEVEDSGAGIASAELKHMFDRFWQARADDRRGHGLGLAIVKGIVEAHGGTIAVRSTVGVGTTFGFVLAAGDGAPVGDAVLNIRAPRPPAE